MSALNDVCNFPDDATFHAYEFNLEDLVNSLEHDANLLIKWLDCGYMKLNEDRCHAIISGHKSKAIQAKVGQTETQESKKQKLLRVIIDHQLSFDGYLISGKNVRFFSQIGKLFKLRTKKTFNEKFC